MTYYNYVCEMQELCFRASQALMVTGEKGLEDFYKAAELGFYNCSKDMPIEKANETIGQSQIDAYLQTKKYAEECEDRAAYRLKEEQEARNGSK